MADKREASSKRKQGSRSSEPAPVRVFARWKPLQAGQTGLQLRLSNTTIEFDVASENKKESKSGRKVSTLAVTKTERMHFELHGVFPHNATQAQVYEEAALPLVDDLLAGYNSTLFAYGQTGAGKTFSMYGPDEVLQDVAAAPEVVRGIVPKTCTRIFTAISADAEIVRATVRCSYLEVYNEKVNDLLMLGQDLKLREDKDKGVYIEGLAAIEVDSEQALCNVVTRGNRSRATSSTAMNERSSRGHTIFLMEVSKVKALEGDANKFSTTAAKLYLVDLAGSENVKQSQATSNKELLREAQNINKSLSTLGICIQKLTSGERDHVPYRDSKLTRILAQTLGGNCKTSLLVALRPEAECVHECVATLRFAQRAKKLTTKTSANLTEELAAREGGAGAGGGGETILAADFERKEEELRDERARLELQLEEEHAHHEAQLQQLQQEARAVQDSRDAVLEENRAMAEELEALRAELAAARRGGGGGGGGGGKAARREEREEETDEEKEEMDDDDEEEAAAAAAAASTAEEEDSEEEEEEEMGEKGGDEGPVAAPASNAALSRARPAATPERRSRDRSPVPVNRPPDRPAELEVLRSPPPSVRFSTPSPSPSPRAVPSPPPRASRSGKPQPRAASGPGPKRAEARPAAATSPARVAHGHPPDFELARAEIEAEYEADARRAGGGGARNGGGGRSGGGEAGSTKKKARPKSAEPIANGSSYGSGNGHANGHHHTCNGRRAGSGGEASVANGGRRGVGVGGAAGGVSGGAGGSAVGGRARALDEVEREAELKRLRAENHELRALLNTALQRTNEATERADADNDRVARLLERLRRLQSENAGLRGELRTTIPDWDQKR